MWNEHFGISIVEMLAAGLLVIAHNSGGPAMDIIEAKPGPTQTGYLASTEVEYSRCMKSAFDLLDDQEACLAMRLRGRDSTNRFSDEMFVNTFIDHFTNFLTKI